MLASITLIKIYTQIFLTGIFRSSKLIHQNMKLKPVQPKAFFNTRLFLLLVYTIYFSCTLAVGIFAFKRPHYNWDMLAYMAIVIKMEHPDATVAQLHTDTYKAAKENIPAPEYKLLTDSTHAYRKKMAEDPFAFYGQLPFYVIKPLYTGSVYLFHKSGFTLPASTVLPSIIGYLLIGLLLFYWLRKYLPLLIAFVAGLLIMFSIYMVNIAGYSSPDYLSAFFLFSAIYYIMEKPSIRMMFFFFLLSLFTRIDNIITCFLMLFFLKFFDTRDSEVSRKHYLLMLFILVASYFTITGMTTPNLGWNILYYPRFIHYFNLSRAFEPTFSPGAYISLFYSQALTGIVSTHFTIFLFLALLQVSYPLPIQFKKFTFEQRFSLLLIGIILVRFVLFPDLDDRFYIAFYLAILILLIKKIKQLHWPQNSI